MRRPVVDDHGVEVPRWRGAAHRIPWQDILAVSDSRGAAVLLARSESGRERRHSLAGMTAGARQALKERWTGFLRSQLASDDRMEGSLCDRDSTPTWLLAVLVAILGAFVTASVVAFARTVAELWPFVEDLPGDARGWFLLTLSLYLGAGLGLVGLLLVVLYQHLVRRREERSFASWRISRDGMARRADDGSWEALGPAPGDRLDQSTAVLGGRPLPLTRISGGELSRQLLYGLARRRGATVAYRAGGKATALRLLLLWPPLLLGGGWLTARFLQVEDPTPLLKGLLIGLAILVPIALILWSSDRVAERRFRELVEGAESLVGTLGW